MEHAPKSGPPLDDLTGRTVGEFVIKERLGEGGFGAVYRAEQIGLSREAVVKVLLAQNRDSDLHTQRFLREARLASQLDHPYAAHVYAFGREPDGLLWIAMELVRGTPLNKHLRVHGPFSLSRWVPLFERICEVVQAAHEAQIIHRDLKPANVMVLARAGKLLPKLLDFGIARLRLAAQEREDLTESNEVTPVALVPGGPKESVRSVQREEVTRVEPRAGTRGVEQSQMLSLEFRASTAMELTSGDCFLGSPSYMAPEQFTAATRVDERADIYALGILCYEALTGRRPFASELVSNIAFSHMMEPPPPLWLDVPPEVEGVIFRALAKRPNDRFASAGDFATALRQAARLDHDVQELPRLEPALLEEYLSHAPQPIAESLASLEGARTPAQAVDAVRGVALALVHHLFVLALAGRLRAGPGADRDDVVAVELLARMRSGVLTPEERLTLVKVLVAPFAGRDELYPVPPLVTLFTRGFTSLEPLWRLSASEPVADAKAAGREGLEDALRTIASAMRAFSPLLQYRVVALEAKQPVLWTGVRRKRRRAVNLPSVEELTEDEPALVDAEGNVVLHLSPLAQVLAPTPMSDRELFLFEGAGRLGARLSARPMGFERQDEQLWSTLEEQGLPFRASAAEALVSEQAPYRGLSSFSTSDASTYFGREAEAQAFANRLRTQTFLAVVGPSGAGKSSFIQAGVIPLLAAGHRVVTARPGLAPLRALLEQLHADGLALSLTEPLLRANPSALAGALSRVTSASSPLLLVIDQFEELLTLCPSPEEREIFARVLIEASGQPEGGVRVVVTLRDDFLIRAQQLVPLRERLSAGLQLLATPAEPDLVRILVEPARRNGHSFEDEALVSEMVREVANQSGALALLSFTAARLWDLRDRRTRQLTRKAYESLGGVAGALAKHAEATLEVMTPQAQDQVREAFRHLVTSEGTRAIVTRSELEGLIGGVDAASSLERLVGARLLVASDGPDGSDQIEVIHEALIRSWPRLVEWQREDQANARMREALRSAARQWRDRGKARGLLWRGDALLEYRLWRKRYSGSIAQAEELFIQASSREEVRGRRLKTAALVCVFAVLASGLLLVANERRKAVKHAEVAQKRLAESFFDRGRQQILSHDPMQGVVYLSRAQREGAESPELRFLTARAADALSAERASLRGHEALIFTLAEHPGGQLFAAGSFDGRIGLYDAARGERLAWLSGHSDWVMSLDFHPDGHTLASAGKDGKVLLWDLASRAQRAELPVASAGARSVSFHPDPFVHLLVVGERSGTTSVWDTRTFQRRLALEGGSRLLDAFWTADGTTLVSVETGGRVVLRDGVSGQVRKAMAVEGTIMDAALDRTGRLVAAATEAGEVRVWQVSDGAEITAFRDPGGVLRVTFDPLQDRLLTAGRSPSVRLWSVPSGRLAGTLDGHQGGVDALAFREDGAFIATGDGKGTVRLWDRRGLSSVAEFVGHTDRIFRVRFDASGRRLISAALDLRIKLWDLDAAVRPSLVHAAGGTVYGVTSAASGNLLVSAGSDATVQVWDARSFERRHQWKLEAETPFIAASAEQVLVGNEKAVELRALRSGEILRRFEGHEALVLSGALSVDGVLVASASEDGTGRLWEASTGRQVAVLKGHEGALTAIRLSPDGTKVATAGTDGTVRLWDARSGAAVGVLKGHEQTVTSLTFTPDGALVSVGEDKRAILWDVEGAALVRRFESGLDAALQAASVDPSGRWLATAGADGVTSVFSLHTGVKVGSFDSQGEAVYDVLFLDQGERLASAGAGGVIQIWPTHTDERPQATVAEWVRCHVPFELVGDQLVKRLDLPDCARP